MGAQKLSASLLVLSSVMPHALRLELREYGTDIFVRHAMAGSPSRLIGHFVRTRKDSIYSTKGHSRRIAVSQAVRFLGRLFRDPSSQDAGQRH